MEQSLIEQYVLGRLGHRIEHESGARLAHAPRCAVDQRFLLGQGP